MEFFGGVIFTKVFRVNPYSSEVSPYFMEVFRVNAILANLEGKKKR